jgi:His/Glu/Gln/Arg/opine family amino acid ABC transporter permease subunit
LNFFVLLQYKQFILKGLINTMILTLVAQFITLGIAIPVAVARMSSNKILRFLSGVYIEFVRGTPTLVQLFWIFFCVPIFFGLDWSPMFGAIIAFSINVGAYDAEVFRAGIRSVHPGQIIASKALGLSSSQTFLNVTLPQATRYVLPALLNNFIGLLLFSSMASTIGVEELTYVAGRLNGFTYQSVAVFTGIGAIYLVVALIISRLAQMIETRYAIQE